MRPYMNKKVSTLTLLLFLLVIYPDSTAHAYLDPSTGSYVIQVATGVLFGMLYMAKVFWGTIRKTARKIFHKKDSS
jgi:hypothetical protein